MVLYDFLEQHYLFTLVFLVLDHFHFAYVQLVFFTWFNPILRAGFKINFLLIYLHQQKLFFMGKILLV